MFSRSGKLQVFGWSIPQLTSNRSTVDALLNHLGDRSRYPLLKKLTLPSPSPAYRMFRQSCTKAQYSQREYICDLQLQLYHNHLAQCKTMRTPKLHEHIKCSCRGDCLNCGCQKRNVHCGPKCHGR